MQGTSHPKSSAVHTTWLLRETVACNIEKGNSVYVALLDTAAAFDTVWIDSMLIRFYKTGVEGKIIIRKFYENFQCSVRIASIYSDWFIAQQGVHQGAIWSLHLFGIAYNEMLVRLKQSA